MSPMTVLPWISAPCLQVALAGALLAQPHPKLFVELVPLPSTLTYTFTFVRRELGTPFGEKIDTTGTIEARPESVFLAVRVVFTDSGGLAVRDDRAILQDSNGTRYRPIAFAPIKLENLMIFDSNYRGAIMDGRGGWFTDGPEPGSSYMVVLKEKGHEFSRIGAAGTSFLLVYRVPATARSFTFSLPRYPPFQLAAH